MGRIWLLEKQKLVLLSNGGSKKTGRTFARGKPVAGAKVKNGVLHIVAPAKGFLVKHPKTTKEMTTKEKRSRISQKKRLGQPAGKPRRVKSLRRKKK